MILRYLYNDQLSQASYLLGSSRTGEALVVDPNRDIDQYTQLVASQGLRITAVTETHIHADFVSGALELAARTGARLYLSDAGPADWKYSYAIEAGATLLRDNDQLFVGEVRVDAWHTPGHTPEHLSFLVTDTASAEEPMGIFTGDFVFVGDVGRPDLLETAAGIAGTREHGARQLHHSLARFLELPDYVQVWPGHGAGSACGRALGAVPQSTVGYERRFNWAFRVQSEAEFVRAVLAGQPETPTYFKEMKRLNREGPTMLSGLARPASLPARELSLALEADTPVVDTRAARSYAEGHVPGTINIPLGSGFVTWAGWLLPYDRPFGLIVDERRVEDAVRELRLIGLDNVAGYWTLDALSELSASGRDLATIEAIDVRELRRRLEQDAVTVVDVRSKAEYAAGHIPGSHNIPLGDLERRLDEAPPTRPVVVHCQIGLRSAIAASVLTAHGRGNVLDLEGGFAAWQAASYPEEATRRDSDRTGGS